MAVGCCLPEIVMDQEPPMRHKTALHTGYLLLYLLFALVPMSWSALADAQQPPKIPRIGVLRPGSPPDPSIEAFRQGLRELGYAEGRNISIEYRWTEGRDERLPDLAADLVRPKVERPDDLGAAFAVAQKDRAEGLIVFGSAFVFEHRTRLVELSAKHRLPTIYDQRQFVVGSGGLMSYGPNIQDLFRRSATYVDKILKGAKPGDLPIEQPTKFELVINLKTAKALGLRIPQSVLIRADEVIR